MRELHAEDDFATSAEAQSASFPELPTFITHTPVYVWFFSPPYTVAARQNVYGFWQGQPTPATPVTGVYKTN